MEDVAGKDIASRGAATLPAVHSHTWSHWEFGTPFAPGQWVSHVTCCKWTCRCHKGEPMVRRLSKEMPPEEIERGNAILAAEFPS